MQSCYSFLKRKQRPHSQAYVVCDDIIFSPNGRNRPDSMTIDWLGRAPVPRIAYNADRMCERPKHIGQPYDSHPERKSNSTNIISDKENKPLHHSDEVNPPNNVEVAASSSASNLQGQEQSFERAVSCSERGSTSSSRDPNLRTRNTTKAPLRRTVNQPEYRIERLLFKPVSISFNSVEVSSREATYIGSTSTVYSWEDGKATVNGESSRLSTEKTQCSERPKPKVRILRMISTPLPQSASASQAQHRSETDVQNGCLDDRRSARGNQIATNPTRGVEINHRSGIPQSFSENRLDIQRDRTDCDPTSLRGSVQGSELDNNRSSCTIDVGCHHDPLMMRETSGLPHGHRATALTRGGQQASARGRLNCQQISHSQHNKGCPPPSYSSINRGASTRASWHSFLRPRSHAVSQRNRTEADDNTNSRSNRIFRFQRQQSTRPPSSSTNPSSSSGSNSVLPPRTATTHAHVTEVLARESSSEGGNRSPCFRESSCAPRSRQVVLPPYTALPEYVSPPSYEQAMLY